MNSQPFGMLLGNVKASTAMPASVGISVRMSVCLCRLCMLRTQFLCCSATLAHLMLNERLGRAGVLGCILCISGSTTIVLHAPEERPISSLLEVWTLALQPGQSVQKGT